MGWDIFVEMSAAWPRGMGGHDAELHRSAQLLAYWSADGDGLDWLEPLIAQDRATMVADSRYPLLFSVPAAELLPLLTPTGLKRIDARLEVAVDTSSFFYQHRVTIRPDVLATCPADAVLTVEAWDRAYPSSAKVGPAPRSGPTGRAVPAGPTRVRSADRAASARSSAQAGPVYGADPAGRTAVAG